MSQPFKEQIAYRSPLGRVAFYDGIGRKMKEIEPGDEANEAWKKYHDAANRGEWCGTFVVNADWLDGPNKEWVPIAEPIEKKPDPQGSFDF